MSNEVKFVPELVFPILTALMVILCSLIIIILLTFISVFMVFQIV